MALTTTATDNLTLTLLDTVPAGAAGLKGAEIAAFDKTTDKIFVTANAESTNVTVGAGAAPLLHIIDAADPTNLSIAATVDFTTFPALSGFALGDISSVAVSSAGIVAVGLIANPKTDAGRVVFIDATGGYLGHATVGSQPDMVTFASPTKVLLAIEGEPGTVDPKGGVSIIDISAGVGSPTVTFADFTGFDAQQATLVAAGLRLFPGTILSDDVEPEYISVSTDGTKAMVTLQEANAVAILNLTTGAFTDIVPLGTKNWSGLQVDFSDRDNGSNGESIKLETGNDVLGLYMPDAISSFQAGGQTFYVIANEGDARSESVRLSTLTLDTTEYPTAGTGAGQLQSNAELGRLNVSNIDGNTDADAAYEQIYTYGGRSFSILNSAGEMVFDSADIIERIIATNMPAQWVDSRSDDKGPEPEGITIGSVGGRTYAFVALERTSHVMAFDVTNPNDVSYATYVNTTGDTSPEGIVFVSAADSPNGQELLIVSNEVSNTLSVYSATSEIDFTLQLLHYYGESGLLGVETAPIMGAMIDAFDNEYTNTLVIGEGDSFIPGPWLIGGGDPSLETAVTGIASRDSVTGLITNTPLGRPDIAIMNAFGTDVSALGNHEFDLGSPVLQAAIVPSNNGTTNTTADDWVGAQFPLITSNLNFAADSSLRGIADKSLNSNFNTNNYAGQEASAIKAKIAPYAVVTQPDGVKIGVVGLTNWDLLSKTSPNGTTVKDDGDAATSDLQEAAAYVQASVDALLAAGVNKIIMVDQLDDLQRNKDLAPLVTGIDVMVAGGGHERMGDATDTAVAFNGHDADFIADTYPIVTAGADGAPVLIVTTDTEYTYLGRLVVDFDANGEIITDNLANMTGVNGAYASTEANLQDAYNTTDSAATIIASSTIGSKVKAIADAIDTIVTTKDGTIYGYTDVYLEGDRVFGRTQETNLGNLSADANAWKAIEALGNPDYMVSLKNGGGLRASIGSVDADGNKIPPAASDVKPAGGISQLDIENALRFDNKLMVFDTNPQGLLNILNYAAGLSSGPTVQNGGYPQVGGIRFSYDSDRPAGQKVSDVSLVDEQGELIARIVDNGTIVADPSLVIPVVALNFTANGGDSYPIKANGSNFRYLLTDGTLSTAVDEALNFTAATTFAAVGQSATTILGEQKALADYLTEFHGTPAEAYGIADTAVSGDTRIQQTNFRADTVLAGETITGTTGNDLRRDGLGDDAITLGDGNDRVISTAGTDTVDGGAGTDTIDFAESAGAVSVNLAAGTAGHVEATFTGSLTTSAPMLTGENGFSVLPLITVGETITGTTGALNASTAGNYQPPGIMDGIGAYSKDASTVRVFVNQELLNTAGTSYTIDTGVSLKGARISYFDIDKTTKAVKDAGLAYNDIYDRSGNLLTSASQLDNPSGLGRFCSGSLYEANQFGTGKGVVDRIYFAGEETSNGTNWALDTSTGNLWALPSLGRGGWENVTQVDTGTTTHVAFLLGDDGPNGMPLYLYVGTKNAAGDFLDKNGLKTGQMYVWKADTAGVNSPAEFASGTQAGSWVAINVRDAAMAGQAGYDALGYKNETTLRAEADTLGAFSFSRPEDLSTNPANGKQIAFASTGASISSANTADGVADATDVWGTVYTMTLDFTSLSAPTGAMTVLYNGNTDANRTLRSPDNLDWADDGMIYVNEDRSTTWSAAIASNPNEASIVRINPTTGALDRVAEVNRAAVPYGQTDGSPTDFGNWETSGILDVSTLFGSNPGTVFLADVQAHSINLGSTSLVEGGQLVMIGAPGTDLTGVASIDTLTSIENAWGSAHADLLIGDANVNQLFGQGGNDTVAGMGGNDVLRGGDGLDTVDGGAGDDNIQGNADNDTLIGGAGLDKVYGNEGNDALDGTTGETTTAIDYLFGGAGDDTYTAGFNDQIVEAAGEGTDTVNLTGSGVFKMRAGSEIEVVNVSGSPTTVIGNEFGQTITDNSGLGANLRGFGGDDIITGNDGADTLWGDFANGAAVGVAGNDELRGGAGADKLYGEAGNDYLFGEADNDTLTGGDGVDTIDGGAGVDKLYGDAGNDVLDGGTENDLIEGGLGNDTMTGGAGSDRFLFRTGTAFGTDTIVDLAAGDKIDLRGWGLAYADLSFASVAGGVEVSATAFGAGNVIIINGASGTIADTQFLF